MDTHVKEGQLYVQHQKFGKKWKKNWFVLYPASQNGIARLEFFDSPSGSGGGAGGGGGGVGTNEKTRKLDKKIIRLSECISILPAVTETCPKENMAAFCVETVEKTHVFAAEKSVTAQWVEIMCDIAFQGGGGSKTPDCNGGPQDLQMSENLIYYSREEVSEFWVSVQRTEASERCSLSGSYWLKADRDSLVLKEAKTKRNVLLWPYKLLRRYGRDRVMFSFEAGRRCDSGPGNFTFETKQGNEIFQLVEQAIKSQKALTEERHLSCPVTFDPDCPPSLQHLRSMAGIIILEGNNNNSGREPDGDSGGSKPGSADGVIGRREGGDGGGGGGGGGRVQGGGGGLHKGRSLPDPPPMMGVLGGEVTPPRSPRHGAVGVGKFPVEELSGVYSEPADSVRLPPPSADSLYSDPIDSIKKQNQPGSNPSGPMPTPRLRPVGDEGNNNQRRQSSDQQSSDQVYSLLYDQVNFELSQMSGSLGPDSDGTGGGRGGNSNRRPPGGQAEGASSSPPTSAAEHIYDEPEGCAKPRATPLAMSIYDEARPEGWRRPSVEVMLASGQEGNYNQENSYSIPSAGKQYTQPYTHAHTHPSPSHTHSEPRTHSPPHSTPNRGGPPAPPTAPRWPKPTTAPKPAKGALPRKDLLPPPPVRPGGSGGNVNNNNGNTGGRDLYSKVSKIKVPPPNLWLNQQTNNQPVLRSPDIIYDNLGDA